MAASKVLIWVTVCTCAVFASPTRRQFNSNPETTSSDPVILVTDEGASWDDSDDDFDLEGGGWMKEVSASPSSAPESPDYEDYDDDEDESDVQSAGSKDESNNSEFLFLQPTDTRLMLEDDDDDQQGIIKVRHTSKNAYSEQPQDGALQTIEKSNSDDQFVFTIDDNDEDFDGDSNKLEDSNKDDDFVLEDSEEQPTKKMTKKDDNSSRREDDDDDDDDEDDDDSDVLEDNTVFDSPEEDAQVIYEDHVFLY